MRARTTPEPDATVQAEGARVRVREGPGLLKRVFGPKASVNTRAGCLLRPGTSALVSADGEGKGSPASLTGVGSCGHERPGLPGSGPGRREEPLTERVLSLVTTETHVWVRQGGPKAGSRHRAQ